MAKTMARFEALAVANKVAHNQVTKGKGEMQKKTVAPTLMMECSEWAKIFAERFNTCDSVVQFYAFKPNLEKIPEACYLGAFTNSDRESFTPLPYWQWHVAVEINGYLYDEVHPSGVPTKEYLNFFEHIDMISVTVHANLQSAIDSANAWTKSSN